MSTTRLTMLCGLIMGLAARYGAADALPDLKIPDGFGVNIHFKGDRPDLDLIADAGFKFIRMDLGWEGMERRKGEYNWEKSGTDALVEGCMRRGIRILFILDYSNKLYEPERSVRSEEGRKAFAAFAAAAVGRYRGKNIIWEVWNEPNIKQFWTPQPSVVDYCKLVEATAFAVKQTDPNALVVGGATSTIPFPWLEECFKEGLLNWIDGLTVHPYRPKNPETVVADYDKLRALIRQYAPAGKDIPILSGEWGYSQINWDKTPLSEERQGQYLVREFLINLWQGVPVSIWYDWKNDGTDPAEREHNFGTMTHDLKPKPAYVAARTLNRTLAGYAIESRVETDNAADFVFRLRNGARTAYAMWTAEEARELRLRIGAGKGTLTDMLGKETTCAWGGEGLSIRLSQSPQYLVLDPTQPE